MMTLAQAAQAVQAPQVGLAALLTAAKNMDGEGIEDFKDFCHKQALSLGLDQPTPEEQQQAANEQQQPDPQQAVLSKQAEALDAQAGKFRADTEQSKARTVLTLAQAKKTNAEAHSQHAQNAGMMHPDAINRIMTGGAVHNNNAANG
jgi:hypothetical protein